MAARFRLLFVRLPDGQQALFRFYDPRVLRDYLPTCHEDELNHFFGPLTAIYLESESGHEIVCFYLDRSGGTGEFSSCINRGMLAIRPEQMEAMERAMMKRFVDKTLDLIRINFPEWSCGQRDDGLTEFVMSIINFAQEHDIRKEISIQKLTACKITFNFSIPLRPELEVILKRAGLDEESRLEYFVRHLEDTSPLIKLTLDDAAEGLP